MEVRVFLQLHQAAQWHRVGEGKLDPNAPPDSSRPQSVPFAVRCCSSDQEANSVSSPGIWLGPVACFGQDNIHHIAQTGTCRTLQRAGLSCCWETCDCRHWRSRAGLLEDERPCGQVPRPSRLFNLRPVQGTESIWNYPAPVKPAWTGRTAQLINRIRNMHICALSFKF